MNSGSAYFFSQTKSGFLIMAQIDQANIVSVFIDNFGIILLYFSAKPPFVVTHKKRLIQADLMGIHD